MSRVALLNIDAVLAAHVASAMRAHRPTFRRNGIRIPELWDELEAWMGARGVGAAEVSEGQRSPISAASPRSLKTRPMSPDDLLTRDESAAYLGLSISTLKRREASGVLRATRHGQIVRYRRDDLDHLGKVEN